MPKFRKKPVVVEARLCDTYQATVDVERWVNANGGLFHRRAADDGRGIECLVDTLEGPHVVSPGDWVVQGVVGEFYPCKPHIFEMTYEPVDE
jgi:hypothetical protein